MKHTTKPVSIRALLGVRYWEDGIVNGIVDDDGTLIPLRNGEYWEITIDLKSGRIKDWPQGVTADVHYKVCDDGVYVLLDGNDEVIYKNEGCYVPKMLDVTGESDGDYVIFIISELGYIQGWKEPDNL